MDDKNKKYLSHMKSTVEESGLNLDDVQEIDGII